MNEPGHIRSVRVATRARRGVWSQAGAACRTSRGGRWWAAVDEQAWPSEAAVRDQIRRQFEGAFGDRRQELVLIGMDMDEPALRAELDGCLLTEAEMSGGPVAWRELHDPFPAWHD